MATSLAEKVELDDGDVVHKEFGANVHAAEYELSEEDDKRILRKIDKCLLPIMAFSYFFQFLDKTALGATAILGIREDLHLTGSEYSWSSAIYYFGYLVASYPISLMMVRWRVGKSITLSIFTWGSILMLTAACHNAAGLLATRIFLGVAEATIAPGLTVIISMWYKRKEQPLRHAAWFLGNTFAGIFGALLSYGIGHINTIAPWKGIFVILGAATVLWSFVAFFLLPDTPAKAVFLSKEDSQKAIVRVKDNMTGIKNDHVKWYQVREALLDVKMLLLFLFQLCSNIPNGGVTTFSSIVIQGFGFSTFDTLLLGSVAYIVQLFLVLLSSIGSSYFKNTRTLWMAWNMSIGVCGAALVRYLPEDNRWGRFVGTVLSGGFAANFPLMMAMLSGNFGGFTKKTTVNAVIFIGYCTGNIVGPQLFFDHEAPTYNSAFLAIMVCLALGFALAFVLRFYLIWENRRRDKEVDSDDAGAVPDAERDYMVNLLDKTDQEIRQFRYVY